MADIALTGQSPRWSNIPDDGIDVAAASAKAAAQGTSAVFRILTGLSDPDGEWPEVAFEIDAGGTVRVLTPGWEPVVADGKVTGLRDLEAASA